MASGRPANMAPANDQLAEAAYLDCSGNRRGLGPVVALHDLHEADEVESHLDSIALMQARPASHKHPDGLFRRRVRAARKETRSVRIRRSRTTRVTECRFAIIHFQKLYHSGLRLTESSSGVFGDMVTPLIVNTLEMNFSISAVHSYLGRSRITILIDRPENAFIP